MSSKALKSKFANFLVALARLINKPKKQIDQETLQKELSNFVQKNGLTGDNFDIEKFQSDFMKYLKDENYDCEGMNVLANIKDAEEQEEADEVKKITDKHNKNF